jgi:predicted DNA-binding transcriptional regulator AlpA
VANPDMVASEHDEPATDLLFIDEVSAWTRIPVNTLKDYRQRGRGPRSAVIGGKIRYRRSDVGEWLDAQFAATQA